MGLNYRTIDVSELRPADILVTTGRAFVSGAIRTTTGTDYSHTVLYVRKTDQGATQVVEAISDGVVERDIGLSLAEASLAVALRRRMMNNESRQYVIDYARDFVGRPYDYIGAVGSGLTHKRGMLSAVLFPTGASVAYFAARRNARENTKDRKFFCSELVARCFQLAGAPISDLGPSWVTPRAVRVSPTLIYVGHLRGGP